MTRSREETGGDPNDFVTVYTNNDSVQAELVQAALQGQGIPCWLVGEHQAGFSGVLDVALQVRAKDADRAHKFIEQHHA